MSEVQDGSVHLIVTFPPYWQLKDYGSEDQIGFNDSYERYINNLNLVWKECFRVLHEGCRLCINIGDQFARSVYYGRYKVIPIHSEIIRFCETIGFDFMGQIIWQKLLQRTRQVVLPLWEVIHTHGMALSSWISSIFYCSKRQGMRQNQL